MKKIMTVSVELEQEARNISNFRMRMKEYLKRFGANYDKFTITGNDSFLGHVTETAIANYIVTNYGERFEVKRWSDSFDESKIKNIVYNSDNRVEAIEYMKKYFYDRYDLEIVDKKSGKSIFVDVKSAETQKQPQDYWDFLYPVVQNNKAGKDCVILCYYYKSLQSKDIILVGYMSEEDISKCKVYGENDVTQFKTTNQIDNYETKVKDYKDLDTMFRTYFG